MTLSNGQTHFWQWDTNQKIKIDGAAKELHYIGIDGAVEVDGDGWAAAKQWHDSGLGLPHRQRFWEHRHQNGSTAGSG